ncbi:dephospho-CoA kinase [Alishewanella longhuensis]|uniref:Dephospho-CoA kinase n=1 Tax=Alishewanella longhuensis TaxID=1091037 RepID=A0ABQ3L8D2_9ALTE|nr:dephospho-CoA kinase [Alishewanella longhuensis]GHG72212.1 dephospho-CoA kinase [Alishewanella longhuensis]
MIIADNLSLLIGLTGGIGSGKSTVADQFAKLGASYVDADMVAREVVAPGTSCLAAIEAKFGSVILQQDGQLDRAALRQLIFQDLSAKQWLESLLHPAIRQQMLQQLRNSQTPYTLLVAPLLLENGLDKLVQRVLVIDVSEETQLLRAIKRDQNSAEQIKAIMAAQFSRQQRLALADDVIDNNGTTNELLQQVAHLHEKYLELSGKIRHKEQ